MILTVKCGVRTHAHFRVPELKSGALDRSANLTWVRESETFAVYQSTVQLCMYVSVFFRRFFGNCKQILAEILS